MHVWLGGRAGGRGGGGLNKHGEDSSPRMASRVLTTCGRWVVGETRCEATWEGTVKTNVWPCQPAEESSGPRQGRDIEYAGAHSLPQLGLALCAGPQGRAPAAPVLVVCQQPA